MSKSEKTPLNLTLCFIHLNYAAAMSCTDCYPDVQCCCSLCVADKRESKAVRQRCLSILSNCLSSCDIDGLNSDTYCKGWQISTHDLAYKHQHSWSTTCRVWTVAYSMCTALCCTADFKENPSLSAIMSKASGDVKKNVRADLSDISFNLWSKCTCRFPSEQFRPLDCLLRWAILSGC